MMQFDILLQVRTRENRQVNLIEKKDQAYFVIIMIIIGGDLNIIIRGLNDFAAIILW